MDNPTFERTPLVIAAEINMITCQTRKILLISAIEIGRRLQEAKVMLKHGEWIEWIEESVDYTRRTASRLMKIYKEYGPDFPEGSDRSNGTPVSHLTYTQALLLLRLPEEERKEFIAQNDVGSMTKQELQQALKDRDQANQAKDQAKAPSRPVNPENIQAQASSTAIAPSAGQTALPTHNLKTKRDPHAHIKYVKQCDACCKTIADTFFDLTTALTNLTHIDPELKEEKRKEANRLIEYMTKTIKEWPPPKKPLRVNS